MDYKEELLKQLTQRYRNSKKDAGTNRVFRATRIKPDKLYAGYYDNNGNIDCINAVNEAIQECQELKFVTYRQRRLSNEIEYVDLIDSAVEAAEQYLKIQYGYQPKVDRVQAIMRLLEQYEKTTPAASALCGRLRQELEKNQIFRKKQDYLHLGEVLKALVFVEQNQNQLYIREASMLLFGNSKHLEEAVLSDVCRELRRYRNRPCEEQEMEDEILREYHIEKEPIRICLKGDCEIFFQNGGCLSVGLLAEGIEFAVKDLETMKRIAVSARRLVTIENKTAYYRYPAADTVVFYLGGFLNRFQRDFLKRIWSDNPHVTWYHFGDIDAGGFYIYEDLCRKTGIPFQTLHMSKEELCREQYQHCLQKLTVQDNWRLQSLKQSEVFWGEKEVCKETVEYMLEHQVKLEQEVISYQGLEKQVVREGEAG